MRKHPDLLETFRHLEIFEHCTDDELAEIDSLADEVHVPAGRVLVRESEVGREFVVVVEGEVTVTRDGEELARIGPGGHFGELSLLTSIDRSATVTAAIDSTVQVIDRRGFQTLLQDSPALTLNLLRSTAQRMVQLVDEIARLRAG